MEPFIPSQNPTPPIAPQSKKSPLGWLVLILVILVLGAGVFYFRGDISNLLTGLTDSTQPLATEISQEEKERLQTKGVLLGLAKIEVPDIYQTQIIEISDLPKSVVPIIKPTAFSSVADLQIEKLTFVGQKSVGYRIKYELANLTLQQALMTLKVPSPWTFIQSYQSGQFALREIQDSSFQVQFSIEGAADNNVNVLIIIVPK